MLTRPDAHELVAPMHPVHGACLYERMRCIAHRLIEFGFEAYVNCLDARELCVLASFLPALSHDALVRRAYAIGDDDMRAWLSRKLPALFAGEVAA